MPTGCAAGGASGTRGRCSTRCRSSPRPSAWCGSSRSPLRSRSRRSPTPGSSPSCTRSAGHRWCARSGASTAPGEPVAQGFLGDLLGHDERRLQRDTGLALERGALGTWLVGEGGALLVTPGGRRVHCFCVGVTDHGAAAVRPRSPPAPGAARGRAGLRDRRESRVRRRAVARPQAPPGADAARPRRGATGRGVASRVVANDVVIAGGGFGGLYAARRLERRLPRHSARIQIVSDVNFLLYTPLMPGAAAGTLEPRHVVVPLREELEWADLYLGRITGADPGVNELYVRTLDERDETLRYDQLDRGARLGVAGAAGPGPRGARLRLQEPRRRDRGAQPRAAEPGDRRVAPG